MRGRHVDVRPALPVWVDLGAAFRVKRPRHPFPDGLDLQSRVAGELRAWEMTTTGHWGGYVGPVSRLRVRKPGGLHRTPVDAVEARTTRRQMAVAWPGWMGLVRVEGRWCLMG